MFLCNKHRSSALSSWGQREDSGNEVVLHLQLFELRPNTVEKGKASYKHIVQNRSVLHQKLCLRQRSQRFTRTACRKMQNWSADETKISTKPASRRVDLWMVLFSWQNRVRIVPSLSKPLVCKIVPKKVTSLIMFGLRCLMLSNVPNCYLLVTFADLITPLRNHKWHLTQFYILDTSD